MIAIEVSPTIKVKDTHVYITIMYIRISIYSTTILAPLMSPVLNGVNAHYTNI